MTYTPAHLALLQTALVSGELRVRFAEREVMYRSIEELKAAIAEVQAQMQNEAGTSIRQHRIHTGKGF